MVVVVTSVTTVLGGGLALRVPDGPFPFPVARFDPRAALRVLGDRRVRLASFGYFGHMWELYAMWAWIGSYLLASFERRGVVGAEPWAIGLTFGRSPWLVLAVGLVWGASVIADSALFSTIVTDVVDQRYVGTAVTLQLALGFVLTVATIWIVPLLVAAVGWSWAFLVLVPGPVLGIAALRALEREDARPAAAPSMST